MEAAEHSKWGLAHNLRLVWRELSRWPRTTLIISGALMAAHIFRMARHERTGLLEIALSAIALIAGFAGLKAALLLAAYRRINKTTYDGSFLVSAAMVGFLLTVSAAAGAALMSLHGADVPLREALTFLLSFFFGGLSLALAVLFTYSDRISRLAPEIRPSAVGATLGRYALIAVGAYLLGAVVNVALQNHPAEQVSSGHSSYLLWSLYGTFHLVALSVAALLAAFFAVHLRSILYLVLALVGLVASIIVLEGGDHSGIHFLTLCFASLVLIALDYAWRVSRQYRHGELSTR